MIAGRVVSSNPQTGRLRYAAPVTTDSSLEPVIVAWSGGKDSALTLDALRLSGQYRVVALLTTLVEPDERVTAHGVPRALMEQQAAAMNLPLELVSLSPHCSNTEYDARTGAVLARHQAQGVGHIAYGDIFLTDVRTYREERLAAAGFQGLFPLWNRGTGMLAHQFLTDGFAAVVTAVDAQRLDRAFAGRIFDLTFLDDLPAGVDPCGENGEFHTLVVDGPILKHPLAFDLGAVHLHDGYYFCDLRPV